ncbi:Cacna1h [Symbiodinium natans]|uniref:Cacna1h protein n=1 Tax=Symbiodinium natans TaxID=878477 RepID=A0A812ILP7_9DINO|nr:Cacna1h [Symbiodinium natans]
MAQPGDGVGSEPWRGAIRSETRAALQEVLNDIGVPVRGSVTHPPSPSTSGQPDARRISSGPTQHLRLPLPSNAGHAEPASVWGRAGTVGTVEFTRGISEGGAEVMLNDAAIAEAMRQWHRHPRKLRSRSTSPLNKKYRRYKSKNSSRGFPQVPTMPAEDKLIRTSRRYMQMANPLLIKELSSPGQSRLAALVESTEFSGFIGAMILANAISIGLQTQHEADTWSLAIPPGFAVSEIVFALIFAVELTLRFAVAGCDFFAGPERYWNIFDMTLILAQVSEQVIFVGIIYTHGSLRGLRYPELMPDSVVLRALRIFRLLRILRILRMMHISSELQAIMTAIVKGMRAFIWTLAFMFLVLYAVGVFLTQCVTDYKVALENDGSASHELQDYFGTLPGTMLSLFQAITDGQEWREMLKPLISEISPWMAVPFCMYISFMAFALLNILTGIFVDSALENAQEEKRRYLLQEVGLLFREAEKEQITWPDFQAQLRNPHMQQLFAALDVDEEDASELFHMLDASHDGFIQSDDFLNGCLRLDGPAKAIDLAAFIEESRKVNRTFLEHAKFVSQTLCWLVHTTEAAQHHSVSHTPKEPPVSH